MGGRWNGREAVSQALAFAVLGGLLVLLFQITSTNLQSRGVHSGFEFLFKPATTPAARVWPGGRLCGQTAQT